jgi:hypothetical protein
MACKQNAFDGEPIQIAGILDGDRRKLLVESSKAR